MAKIVHDPEHLIDQTDIGYWLNNYHLLTKQQQLSNSLRGVNWVDYLLIKSVIRPFIPTARWLVQNRKFVNFSLFIV
jgi:hypothetical protein